MSENDVFTFTWKKKKGEKECDYLQVIGSIYQIETRLKKNKLRTSRLNKKARYSGTWDPFSVLSFHN